ncbi:right-handed parallel beta-helix repeat-containing protein [Luteolibacter marinus]|uniref:right-handed parallel beta-helix repeat-containing protein n=1 Tax=Luteolibacter marinus TaxID=2776705 RepID=UPI001867CFE1|nr:right-handed parallel beta-helix repeat-containing protein [Luteolibacter marinus]
MFVGILLAGNPLRAAEVKVSDRPGLAAALRGIASGDVLKIGPGEYGGGHFVTGIENLTVEASDPDQPPEFTGGKEAWHFSKCPGLTLRNLRCRGQSGNGINLDDGGRREQPVTGVTIEGVVVEDTGPVGNFDAIKCSGLDGLIIRSCKIQGWGGQAIDLVGCHKVLITGCSISGKPGFSQHTGPQFKGGCEDVTIEKCRFKDAGERPIQAGGSTGLDFFRPPGAKYEARRIVIRGNVIEGGTCACAFTGVDGAEFTGNTVRGPEKWIFRMLQETREPGFAPCRNIVVKDNSFLFERAKVKSEINIGPGTSPETSRFEGNRWFAADQPDRSAPVLPVEEKDGTYGRPPQPAQSGDTSTDTFSE